MYKLTPFEFNYSSPSGDISKKIFSREELVFDRNELVLISGESGAGKSTFLNLLKGLSPEFIPGILEGKITFLDREVNSHEFNNFKNKIVYLFQNPFSQLIHRNLNLEFAFTLENLKSPESQFGEIKDKFSKKFGLDDLWERETFKLSNGECQKLVLASLLAMGPQVILLDEPTAFLDPEARDEFYKLLNEIKKNHLIFLVDHHLNEVESIVDEKIWINLDGEVKRITSNSESNNELDNSFLPSFEYNNESVLIKLTNISFSYGENKKIIQNVTETFKSGEVIVVKGKNGKGKSTFFKIIANILKIQSGNIDFFIKDKKVSSKELEKKIGFVFQNPENNFFYDFLCQEFEGGNSDLIKLFFTDSELKRSPYLFSEGQKRRISILINVVLNKKILFLDEPTFGQDQKNIDKITAIVNQLKNKNYLIFIISHNEDFISEVASRVFELKEYKLNEVK